MKEAGPRWGRRIFGFRRDTRERTESRDAWIWRRAARQRCCARATGVRCRPQTSGRGGTARAFPSGLHGPEHREVKATSRKSSHRLEESDGALRSKSARAIECPEQEPGAGWWRPGGTFPPRGKGVACIPSTRPDDVGRSDRKQRREASVNGRASARMKTDHSEIGESRGKSGRACIDHKAAPATDHCDGQRDLAPDKARGRWFSRNDPGVHPDLRMPSASPDVANRKPGEWLQSRSGPRGREPKR